MSSGNKSPRIAAGKFPPAYDALEKPFVTGKIAGPHMVNWFPFQRKWLKETAEKLTPILHKLHDQRAISPAAVLYILAHEKSHVGAIDQQDEILRYLMRDYLPSANLNLESLRQRRDKLSNRAKAIMNSAKGGQRRRLWDLRNHQKLDKKPTPKEQDFQRLVAKIDKLDREIFNGENSDRVAAVQKELAKRLSGERQKLMRAKDLKTIDDCLGVLNIWKFPRLIINPSFTGDQFDALICDLRAARDYIEQAQGAPPHRPTSDLKHCAYSLASFFKHVTGNPLYETIGKILNATFPDQWLKPKSDKADVVRKWLGKKTPSRSLMALEAIDMQERNQQRAEYWEQQRAVGADAKLTQRAGIQ